MMPPGYIGGLVRTSYETDLGPVRAFLPGHVPQAELPPPLDRFTAACDELPSRFPSRHGGVRAWLDGLFRQDPLDVGTAAAQLDEGGAQTLHTALCVLGHTYRWDTVPPAPERFDEQMIRLPPGIAGPWSRLAESLDVPRVGSAWTLHLTNWRMRDRPGGAAYRPGELSREKVGVARNWLGPPVDSALENFSISFVLLEAIGAEVLAALVESIECASASWVEGTLAALRRMRAAIAAMTLAFSLNVRRRTVDPAVWLELVQPTFAWAAYTERPPCVEGGPSGLQLGTIQALDAALCIEGGSGLAQLAGSARRHMPAAHRRFLATLDAAGPVLRAFVRDTGCPELTEQLDGCVAALSSFRVTHRARGSLYLASRPSREVPRASTGLVIGIDDNPVVTFERSMSERIGETRAALSRRDTPRALGGRAAATSSPVCNPCEVSY